MLEGDTSCALSVIVPVYKAGDSVVHLLTALTNQKTSFPFEVIIVDDHSPDDTVLRIQNHLKTLRGPAIKLFCLKKNTGPAAARNHAISQAKGAAFLLIDADCSIPHENYVAEVYRARTQYPQAIIAGGIRGQGKGYIAFADRYCHWSTNVPTPSPRKVSSGHVVTTNMLIPRAVFAQIGPFSDKIRTGEDTAFCLEAHQSGIEIRLHGELMINHHDREKLSDFLNCFYKVGRDRAASRRVVYGQAPWYLDGPGPLRWLIAPFIAVVLTLRHFVGWWPYDKKIFFALPGIFAGMLAMGVGVAVGRKK